jgi:hypothetical protein
MFAVVFECTPYRVSIMEICALTNPNFCSLEKRESTILVGVNYLGSITWLIFCGIMGFSCRVIVKTY